METKKVLIDGEIQNVVDLTDRLLSWARVKEGNMKALVKGGMKVFYASWDNGVIYKVRVETEGLPEEYTPDEWVFCTVLGVDTEHMKMDIWRTRAKEATEQKAQGKTTMGSLYLPGYQRAIRFTDLNKFPEDCL